CPFGGYHLTAGFCGGGRGLVQGAFRCLLLFDRNSLLLQGFGRGTAQRAVRDPTQYPRCNQHGPENRARKELTPAAAPEADAVQHPLNDTMGRSAERPAAVFLSDDRQPWNVLAPDGLLDR